jgi:pimeloyl-ACP methyl ester carboxylesterase
MTCQLTGQHEWDGLEHQIRPDPFGGWVVASNYLTHVPGFEDAHEVAALLHELASAASSQRIPAWDAHHDPLIEKLRESLPQRHRAIFDLFATPSGRCPRDVEESRRMAIGLAEACRRMEPLLDPAGELTRVDLPTQLIHGRGDRLIPFTEGLRLHQSLPPHARRGVTVTGLFDHTADATPAGKLRRTREKLEMFSAIRDMINTV